MTGLGGKMLWTMAHSRRPHCSTNVKAPDVCVRKSLRSQPSMGLVRITSWYPNFNGSHFGLPPTEIHRMTGLPPIIVWTMTYSHRPHCCVRTITPFIKMYTAVVHSDYFSALFFVTLLFLVYYTSFGKDQEWLESVSQSKCRVGVLA